MTRTSRIIGASAFAAFLISFALPRLAAAEVELSIGGSFSRTNYSDVDYTWNRRWGVSAGYYFTERSGIELAFQDIVDRSRIAGYEDTTFHDMVYSANWNQAFTGRKFPVQPYVKIGIGQLNRDASGTYANGAAPPITQDQLTGVLGAGVKIFLTQSFGIRAEATTYLAGGNLGKWKDNFGLTFGTSFYF
jgi:hypothetical protein